MSETCYLRRATGEVLTRQEWIDKGFGDPSLSRYGDFITAPCAKTEQGKAAVKREFSVSNNLFSMQNIFLFLIIARLAKTPEGLNVLRDVALQMIKTLGSTMDAVARASVGNPVSAWANPYLLSIIFERFGIVPHERMAEFRIGLSVVSGVGVAKDVLESFTSMLPFSGEKPSDFPQTIDFGDKYELQRPETLTFARADQKKK